MDFKIDIEDYMKSIHTIRQQNGYYVSCHDHHYSFDMFHFYLPLLSFPASYFKCPCLPVINFLPFSLSILLLKLNWQQATRMEKENILHVAFFRIYDVHISCHSDASDKSDIGTDDDLFGFQIPTYNLPLLNV